MNLKQKAPIVLVIILGLTIGFSCHPSSENNIDPASSQIQGIETNVQLEGQIEMCEREPESVLCTGDE